MKKTFFIILLAAFTILYGNLSFAQQYDSLFCKKTLVKLFYFDSASDSTIADYINDTSSWIPSVNFGIDDLKNKNELLIKTVYTGREYENPCLVLAGLSSGFQVYQNSKIIYSAGKQFNQQKPRRFFDSHIIPLEKPLVKSVFVVRVHFKSNLDITGFTTAFIGETYQMAELVKDRNRELQHSELVNFVLGIFLLFASFFALAAFFIRIKHRDWLLFWFFVFSASQGYVFVLDYLMIIGNLSPIFIISSSVIVENLVPIGVIGVIAKITDFSKKIIIRLMILLHLVYTALHISLIHFDLYNIIFWILIVADIIIFIYVLLKSKIYKNPDFRIPVMALCTLIVLVILDIFAVFDVFFIAADLSSYGMLFVAISFAWYIERALFYSRQKNLNYQIEISKVNNKLLNIENKNVIAQYEALKNQVNPHFLFNSLNTLSSLIRHNNNNALRFIEEFADIYQYVLDASDKTLININEEISFVNSYTYLQKLRYGKNFEICFANTDSLENRMVIPLSIQILVENAIKHNEISEIFPLRIEVFYENDYLIIRNKMKKLNYEPVSKQIGLKNLSARYAIITDNPVIYGEENDFFTAKIPLIKMEDY